MNLRRLEQLKEMEAQRFENGPLVGEVEVTRRTRGLGRSSSWNPRASEKSKDWRREGERIGRVSVGMRVDERSEKEDVDDLDGGCVANGNCEAGRQAR